MIDPLTPPILGPLFGLSEFALLLAKRSGAGARSADSGSLTLIWGVILAALAAATLTAALLPQAHSELLQRARLAGGGLFLSGLALRWYAIFYLGRFFTVNVAIAADHHVVDTGPYRLIRHPSYAGSLLEFIGFGITYANWVSLALLLPPALGAFLHRMRIEERALSQALGEPYRSYIRHTKRLIPGIY